jgi:hypothetical protein
LNDLQPQILFKTFTDSWLWSSGMGRCTLHCIGYIEWLTGLGLSALLLTHQKTIKLILAAIKTRFSLKNLYNGLTSRQVTWKNERVPCWWGYSDKGKSEYSGKKTYLSATFNATNLRWFEMGPNMIARHYELATKRPTHTTASLKIIYWQKHFFFLAKIVLLSIVEGNSCYVLWYSHKHKYAVWEKCLVF